MQVDSIGDMCTLPLPTCLYCFDVNEIIRVIYNNLPRIPKSNVDTMNTVIV